MQLELFKPAQPRMHTKKKRAPQRLAVRVGKGAVGQTADEQPRLGKSKDLADLISQLEESKFVRLFRHLVNSNSRVGMGGFDIGEPAVPLDLPDAELQFKLAGSTGSMGSSTAAWLFQIAHEPAFLWRNKLAEGFFSERLTRAFANLAKMWPTIQSTEPSDGPHTRFHAASEGCDSYYLFTNICHDISEKALEKFSDTAHKLFGDVVGVPRNRHPAFGIGTPETVFENAHRELSRFAIDLLNIPSSYYFVAREGRISVAQVTERGAFLASPEGSNSVTGLAAVATSALCPKDKVDATSFSDFESLINNRSTREQDLQRFLAKNPRFLFALDERYCEIRPHVCLFDGKGERLVPDFMARIEDSNIWNTIELKLPQSPTTVSGRAIEKASAVAARGIAELLRYRDFFSTRENRNRVTNRFGTAPYEPCLVLIIGRGRRTHRYEWSSVRAGFPRVGIVSYDYVFERAKECAAKLIDQNQDRKCQTS